MTETCESFESHILKKYKNHGIFIHVGKYNNPNFLKKIQQFNDWKCYNIEIIPHLYHLSSSSSFSSFAYNNFSTLQDEVQSEFILNNELQKKIQHIKYKTTKETIEDDIIYNPSSQRIIIDSSTNFQKKIKSILTTIMKIHYLFLDTKYLEKIYTFLTALDFTKIDIKIISFVINDHDLEPYQYPFIKLITKFLFSRDYIFHTKDEKNIYYFIKKTCLKDFVS